MRLSLGPLQVTIKHTYPRGKTTIYQRAIPTDLKPRYPSATIKQNLKTNDPIKVARMVAALNDKLEAEWNGLRAAPESSPKALKAHADAFLKARRVAPGAPDNHPVAIELIHDHMDSKRMQYARGDDWEYHNAAPEDYLSPVEIEAGRLLHGTAQATLTRWSLRCILRPRIPCSCIIFQNLSPPLGTGRKENIYGQSAPCTWLMGCDGGGRLRL